VKFADAVFRIPPEGPVKVNVVAGAMALGVTGLFDAAADEPGPMIFTACTDRSYGTPFVKPVTEHEVVGTGQLADTEAPPACGVAVAR
jgi:hypothetical protein